MTANATAPQQPQQPQPRTSFRRQRLQALAGLAAVTLAMGALTACGEDKPAKSERGAESTDSDSTTEGEGDTEGGGEATGGEDSTDDAGTGSDSEYFTLDDVAVWEDSGMELSVEAVSPYTPGEYALLENEGYDSYKVDFALTNNGSERLSTVLIIPTGYDADGIEAARIYDGDVGMGFQENVDPGVTVTAEYAFEVPPGTTSFTVEIGDIMTEQAVWKFEL